MYETLLKLSEAHVAEYHLSELATNSNSLDSFFKSFGLDSSGGTIFFNPPERSSMPEDFPSLDIESPCFRPNSNITQETLVPRVENDTNPGFGLPVEFIVAGGLGSIFYLLATSFSQLANDTPPASPIVPAAVTQGEASSAELTQHDSSNQLTPNEGGGAGDDGGDGGDNRRGPLPFEEYYQERLSVEELLKKLQQMIEGLIHNIPREEMARLFYNYKELDPNLNSGFSMTIMSRALGHDRRLLSEIAIIGQSQREPRFFTRKLSNEDSFSVVASPKNIAKLKNHIKLPLGRQARESDRISNSSIESIDSRRISRAGSRQSGLSRAASVQSGASKNSYHNHNHSHYHPQTLAVNEGAGTSAPLDQQAIQRQADARDLLRGRELSRLEMENPSGITAKHKSPITETEPATATQKKDHSVWLKSAGAFGALGVVLLGGGIYGGRRRTRTNNRLGIERGRQDFASGISTINNDYRSWRRLPWDHQKMPRLGTGNTSIQPQSNQIEESMDFRKGRFRSFEATQANYVRKHPRHSERAQNLTSPEDGSCLDLPDNTPVTPDAVAKLLGFLSSILGSLATAAFIRLKRRLG